MKLSDIKGDAVFDVIAEITEPIINIATDPKVAEAFKKEELPKGMTVEVFGALRLKKIIPLIVKEHRMDAVNILASINMIPVEDYRKGITIISLINDISEMLTDPQVQMLFTSAQSSQTFFTSAPESIGEEVEKDTSNIVPLSSKSSAESTASENTLPTESL